MPGAPTISSMRPLVVTVSNHIETVLVLTSTMRCYKKRLFYPVRVGSR